MNDVTWQLWGTMSGTLDTSLNDQAEKHEQNIRLQTTVFWANLWSQVETEVPEGNSKSSHKSIKPNSERHSYILSLIIVFSQLVFLVLMHYAHHLVLISYSRFPVPVFPALPPRPDSYLHLVFPSSLVYLICLSLFVPVLFDFPQETFQHSVFVIP